MKAVKKILIGFITTFLLMSIAYADSFDWAKEGVEYCVENKIMQGDEKGNLNLGKNLTRAEMAKMVSVACNVKTTKTDVGYSDVNKNDWFYPYLVQIQDYITGNSKKFRPSEYATREDFFACFIYAAEVLVNVEEDVLSGKFDDADEISKENREALNAAVFHGYVKGDERGIRPLDNLTRAEACVFLERILNTDEPVKKPVDTEKEEEEEEEQQPTEIDGVPLPTDEKYTFGKTSILGDSEKTLEQAIFWAKKNNAAQCFIDVAPLYWKYGEAFGIRADVMYAQAAKETGFGKYTGKVKPEMNNWAGIKKYGAVGDETDDHETFLTPDDGVRGHFNHMSAYVGVEPLGETHGRYKSVKSLAWAGTVEFVQQLGGKWCPDRNYGYSILADYVDKM